MSFSKNNIRIAYGGGVVWGLGTTKGEGGDKDN